jgi:proteic killer suppression protein
MIRSFRDRRTERFAAGERVPAFEGFRRQGEKRLRILEAATDLRDLGQLPSNRLEGLSGNRVGQYSVRINMQWRICFEWPAGSDGAENVEIVDYH